MFGSKKLAKRSIVGTRVSALSTQDGRFYPGVIHSQVSEGSLTSNAVYIVTFDDGFRHQVTSRNIIGPGFQTVMSVFLKLGQKVYLTLKGREVCGVVYNHDRDSNEVVVSVRTPSGEDFSVTRKLEDLRLLESRRSARLVDSGPLHSPKILSDGQQIPASDLRSMKRLMPSNVIDVPTYEGYDHVRRQRRPDEEMDLMDETVAALVLTSLSLSPKSPSLTSAPLLHQDREHTEDKYRDLSSSVASSGFYSGHSERDDHSPPLSESAPVGMGYEPSTPGSDDDSSNSSGRLLIEEDEDQIAFRCTWRGCSRSTATKNAIERHIRRDHFNRDSDLEMTDNEEDFHYTELDDDFHSIHTMTESFAEMNTSCASDEHKHATRMRHASEDSYTQSPNTPRARGIGIARRHGSGDRICRSLGSGCGMFDHDYQRKIVKQIPDVSLSLIGGSLPQARAASLPISIDQGQIQRSLSWHLPPSSPGLVSPSQRPNKLSLQERLYQHQAQSPKSSIAPTSFKVNHHRRARSEVRKCRKVYGMDNRDQWCTQCKWKKACTRFID